MTLLINSKLLFNEYFYYFFEIFLVSGSIVNVLNKIFQKNGLYADFNFYMSINELIELIKASECYEKENINYSKLNDFLYKKVKEQEK